MKVVFSLFDVSPKSLEIRIVHTSNSGDERR